MTVQECIAWESVASVFRPGQSYASCPTFNFSQPVRLPSNPSQAHRCDLRLIVVLRDVAHLAPLEQEHVD